MFIGTGNVAQHIAQSFKAIDDIHIIQAFNHINNKRSKEFAKQFNCELVSDFKRLNTSAHLYIIAVKDDVIVNVANELKKLPIKGTIVHTSGSVSLDVFKDLKTDFGVYYPLQSFYPNASINWKNTPILLEGNSKKTLSLLKGIAKTISDSVKVVSSEKRLNIHLAAVFACNFTNAMYVAAYQIIEGSLNKTDTKLLLPIMRDSFSKLEKVHPKLAQTGPAKRNDKTVMQKHLSVLKNNKDLTSVYKIISQLISSQQTQ